MRRRHVRLRLISVGRLGLLNDASSQHCRSSNVEAYFGFAAQGQFESRTHPSVRRPFDFQAVVRILELLAWTSAAKT